jgi:hypothetical protein
MKRNHGRPTKVETDSDESDEEWKPSKSRRKSSRGQEQLCIHLNTGFQSSFHIHVHVPVNTHSVGKCLSLRPGHDKLGLQRYARELVTFSTTQSGNSVTVSLLSFIVTSPEYFICLTRQLSVEPCPSQLSKTYFL